LSTAPTVFFAYRDSPLRRRALGLPPGAGERYSLYGLDQVAESGFQVSHNLEPSRSPGVGAGAVGSVLDRAVRAAGGYSGDFASMLACRRELNRADVVFSTVDTVGIPLVLLARAGLVRTPIVYAAIGLPERLAQLRTGLARRRFLDAYRRLHAVIGYGWGEVEELRAWLGEDGPRVALVPFGVDVEFFRPDDTAKPVADVVSVGADPRRDFALLVELARRLPEHSFRIVASADNAHALGGLPENVSLEVDVPFARARECLLGVRVVALPVRENSYSGATTTLLQAMACGKPVVVSRTAAIAQGYHLEDGENCRLVPPGDPEAFERAVVDALDEPELGARARETMEKHHTWRHYTDAIRNLLAEAAGTTVRA
jgi:glycosyltransferase involved in cell wall biosynthesis